MKIGQPSSSSDAITSPEEPTTPTTPRGQGVGLEEQVFTTPDRRPGSIFNIHTWR